MLRVRASTDAAAAYSALEGEGREGGREGGSRPAGGPVSGGDAVTAAAAQSVHSVGEKGENTVIQHIFGGAPSRRGLMIFRGAEEEGPLAKCCHVTRCLKT